MIESTTNPKIKYAMKLKQKKYRNKHNQFLIEGEHLVIEAIKSKQVDYIFSTDPDDFLGYEVIQVSPNIYHKLSELGLDFGMIAVCHKKADFELSNKLLMLDGVQDPGNLGTLIRSAAAFGFKTILSENTVDFYNEKVIRGSQGALFYTNLLETNLEDFIKSNPEYTYYSTNVLNGKPIKDTNFYINKVAIILGNEGSGVRDCIQTLANENILIPMEQTESLNVGVAGGIIMYEAYLGGK